ncbi:MAG: TatD family hydrolase [Pseudoflavonifractor capillosus]|uniref:TatD family hydrolase n=1 Tax=Pseudoflavonifractor capillosus TaxID=106588 RepID=UPI0023F83281|nr:TatD family hydrolase [Pseudoflavonifractor capillosus]MCI5927436.1 TatD family hydrolase [Pseudoflavonifractor capillosus]MDY4660610.1 TatD family hydrolase [Pseudoflavonifractor capillosus]
MYFDTHAHYYDDAFDADRDEVLSALPAAGVELALCPGCDLVSSRQSVALAERYPHLYAAVGFHPENLEGVSLDQLSEIEAMAAHPKVKAIGEIGLDYYWEKDPDKRKLQRDFCSAQLSLAEKLDLPVIFHDREAHKDSLDMVRAHPNARGVFHCYSGGVEDAKTLVIMGWMVSFTGVVTFKNARRALEVIEWLPMDHIMIETDAPYMAPEPYRGKRNDSRYVFRMAEAIAQVKGLTAEEVGRITTENGKRFFNIP